MFLIKSLRCQEFRGRIRGSIRGKRTRSKAPKHSNVAVRSCSLTAWPLQLAVQV